MPKPTHENTSTIAPNWMMWIAQSLFGLFFVNVVVQRQWPGLIEISPALEASLLVLATACFISACLHYERRRATANQPAPPNNRQ